MLLAGEVSRSAYWEEQKEEQGLDFLFEGVKQFSCIIYPHNIMEVNNSASYPSRVEQVLTSDRQAGVGSCTTYFTNQPTDNNKQLARLAIVYLPKQSIYHILSAAPGPIEYGSGR